jgi:hypothetical protein
MLNANFPLVTSFSRLFVSNEKDDWIIVDTSIQKSKDQRQVFVDVLLVVHLFSSFSVSILENYLEFQKLIPQDKMKKSPFPWIIKLNSSATREGMNFKYLIPFDDQFSICIPFRKIPRTFFIEIDTFFFLIENRKP